MGIGLSIIGIAVGAILAFAVNANVSGLEVHTVGWIVLCAGVLGLVLSIVFWSSWGGPAYFSSRRTVVEEAPRPGY